MQKIIATCLCCGANSCFYFSSSISRTLSCDGLDCVDELTGLELDQGGRVTTAKIE